MKEDVLEQLIDDFLMHDGYFTRHNIKFKPRKNHPEYISEQDSVASDIDVIGIHPLRNGRDRVIVVSCKAWQSGFDPQQKVNEIQRNSRVSGREAWKAFRELTKQKWSEAFVAKVEEVTGSNSFSYWTVVTQLRNAGRRHVWEKNKQFLEALSGNPIRIVTLKEILDKLWPALTQTSAASEIGRAIQLMKASGWNPPHQGRN